MNLVIDAQIVKTYFEIDTGGTNNDLTASPVPIFERLGGPDKVHVDDGHQIEHEWSQVVQPEWFSVWLARLLQSDGVAIVTTAQCKHLRRELRQLGFPTHGQAGRDFWYIRTAKSLSGQISRAEPNPESPVFIISEDLHFHSPAAKATSSHRGRIRILRSSRGPVVRHLRRYHNIQVTCVENYVALL